MENSNKQIATIETFKEVLKLNEGKKNELEIIKSNLDSITSLGKTFGNFRILQVIMLQIVSVLEFFNLKSSMSENQISETAKLVYDEYHFLTIADIALCFKNARLGKYGKLYAAIDGQVILLWFKQYCLERSNIAEDLALNEHQERKFAKTDIHPDIKQKILVMLEEKKKQQEQPKVEGEVHELPAHIQEWFNEFDALSKAQKYPRLIGTNIGIVEYKGKSYTQDGFLMIKQKELNKLKNK